MKQTKKQLHAELAMTHRRLDQSIAAERELEDKLILCQERLHTQIVIAARDEALRKASEKIANGLLGCIATLQKEARFSILQEEIGSQVAALLGCSVLVCPECGAIRSGPQDRKSGLRLCDTCSKRIKWPYEKKYERDTSGRMDPALMERLK